MRRRVLLRLLAAAPLLRPLVGVAEEPVARIGLLGVPPPADPQIGPIWQAFLDVLRQKGWIAGRNVIFDRRWSGGRPEGYPQEAAELVAAGPNLIIALSSQAIQAAHQQTSAIPIVAVGAGDLVALGLVKSLGHPGGNVTGFGIEEGTISALWLQMLHQARPGLSRVAVFFTPANPASKLEYDKSAAAAAQLGVALDPIAIDVPEDFASAFAALRDSTADGLVVHTTPVLWSHAGEIAGFAIARRLPSVTGYPAMARDGLLLSYSPDFVDMWRRAGVVVDKLLRGVRPADIPVELPTKFELVINLKTAKALGLTVPQTLLARADEIIE